MTDTHIAHAFPNLSEGQALLALLSETLEMARDMKLTQSDLEAAGVGTEQAKELITSAGLKEEIAAAEKTAHATVVQILTRVSEQDLQDGRDKGLLTSDDYQEALTAKRTLSLARGRAQAHETEREG